MAVRPDQMVTVDGVRYEPDGAPKKKTELKPEAKQAEKPANKARTASNK